MRLTLLILACLICAAPLRAQYAEKRASPSNEEEKVFELRQLYAPGLLILGGTAIHFTSHDSVDGSLRSSIMDWRGNASGTRVDDYIQYLPVVLDLGLGLTGVKAEKKFVDRGIEAVLAYGSMAVLVYGCKLLVDSPRPDGSDNSSFPSGHAAKAFTGAELVRMEYGPWWGLGAYVAAAATSVLRLYNDAHWFSDVLVGAGIGILCAHIGEWLLVPVKNLLGIRDSRFSDAGIMPAVDPVTGSVGATLALRF